MEHEEYVDYEELSRKQAKEIEDLHVRVASMYSNKKLKDFLEDTVDFFENADPIKLMIGTYIACTIATTIVTIAMDLKRGFGK